MAMGHSGSVTDVDEFHSGTGRKSAQRDLVKRIAYEPGRTVAQREARSAGMPTAPGIKAAVLGGDVVWRRRVLHGEAVDGRNGGTKQVGSAFHSAGPGPG